MRISLLIFGIIASLSNTLLANRGEAQSIRDVKVSLNIQKLSVDMTIQELQRKSGFNFVYNKNEIKGDDLISLQVRDKSVKEVLDSVFRNTSTIYRQEGKMVYLQKKADPGRITGTVRDASTHESLIGVVVTVKNSTISMQTDANGHFELQMEPGTYQLSFRYIGFETQERTVTVTEGQRQNVEISLVVAQNNLQEVVVSYGKQKAREVTGSIAEVKASDLQDMPVGQFAQQLQGKVAGVQIAQSSGQPGRGIEFRIRGAASLFADSQPLFVIDGMPITGSVNNINPSEIESFTILKDASASALYGSRAANGVILITTRHAKANESKIELSSNYGLQKIPSARVPKLMNATEFAQFMKERFEDRAKYEGYTGGVPEEYQNPGQYGTGTNWFDELTQTAPIQNYDLIVQSAREKSSSTVIAGYQSQEGVLINTGTKLFSLRINQDLSLSNNKLKVGFNLAPSYRLDHNNRLTTDGVNGLFEKVVEASPLYPAVNPDGSMPKTVSSPGMVNYLNPYAQFTMTKDDFITTRILGNAYLNYELVKGLTIKGNLGVDKGAETHNQFIPSFITTNAVTTGFSGSVDNYSWTAETNLQYEKTFLQDHHLEALVGYSAQKFHTVSNSVSGTGFPNDDVPYISAATVISAGSSTTSQYALLSTLARINYNYKGRYLLSGAIRRDGSSKFGADRKYGNFPSISAGWIISDESFMQDLKSINFLKVRGSYGITGNNFFSNFAAIAGTGSFNYVLNGVLVPGTTINSLGNTELAWERNKQLNLGLELGVLQNRLSFTYDYYHKISDGLIQNRPIPRASGFSSIIFNVGVFELWGHELGLNSTNLTGKLQWNTSLNMSFDRNLIKKLVDPGFIRRNNTVTSDYFRQQAGHHLGEFYGFVFLGLYKDAEDLKNSAKYGSASDIGTIKVADINGDGVIDNENDRTFIGDPTPDFSFGITNNLKYKNFDFNISMAGSVGGDILAAAKWAYSTNLDGSRLPLAAAKDRWRSEENPGSGVYPRTKTGTTAMGRQVNTQWIEDGSYLTAKNISLGYTLPLRNNLMLKNIRLYASVQQAFTITGYSGMNPEINNTGLDATKGIGVDENAYPVARTFSLGLTTTFK